jgi:hypothetical protein
MESRREGKGAEGLLMQVVGLQTNECDGFVVHVRSLVQMSRDLG